MPEHFPDAKSLENFDVDWIWNVYNEKREEFGPKAEKILESLTII